MRKLVTIFLVLMMMWTAATAETAQSTPDFVMEGFDGDSISRDWNNNLFFTRMEDKTGISFSFSQYSDWEQWNQRKAEIAAGKNLPDVLFKAGLTASETEAMVQNGILIDLKPYLEEYAPNLWKLLQENESWLADITLPDGSIPTLPCINTLQNNDTMWINSQWLKTLGLEAPATADDLTDVLRAFKNGDPNRNGKADEVPLTFIGMWELRFLGHAFGITDNDYYISIHDGQVTSSLTSQENRAFLLWLNTLWKEQLLDHNGFTTVDSLRMITDSKAVIPYGMMLSTSPLTVVPSDSLGQFSMLEPLRYNGKQEYRNLLGELIPGTFAITKECRDPGKLMTWVDCLYSTEGNRMAHYGLENEEWVWTPDGTWDWVADDADVANYVLGDSTISDGGIAPGLTDGEFQLQYDDNTTRNAVEQLFRLKTFEKAADPIIHWSGEDRVRLYELQLALSQYAEKTMACFVTGDTELNDETWNEFTAEVNRLGLEEVIALWQKYVK